MPSTAAPLPQAELAAAFRYWRCAEQSSLLRSLATPVINSIEREHYSLERDVEVLGANPPAGRGLLCDMSVPLCAAPALHASPRGADDKVHRHANHHQVQQHLQRHDQPRGIRFRRDVAEADG